MSKKSRPPLTDKDGEAREMTAAALATFRPARETHPKLAEASRRMRGPQKAPKKVPTTIRLDADVRAHFEASGKGWQTRLNDTLRAAIFK